jgi:acyl-CoA thioesterase-2
MQKALDQLLSLLDVEELEVNIFRAHSPQEGSQRVFGGQVLGQALVAAGRTVDADESPAHSFHAYFLRPGDPTTPILYQVDRTKDGRAFTTRRVIAIQHGRAIFHMEVSFHRSEPGFEHQDEMPDASDPESLPSWRERIQPMLDSDIEEDTRRWLSRDRALDSRYVTKVDPIHPGKLPPQLSIWIKADGQLPEPLLIHQCVIAYASDMSLLDTAVLPHDVSWLDGGYQIASLDHAMWFHRDFRADDWLLYVQESPTAAGGRGFSTGRLFTRDGRLVASVVQEGLIRRVKPPDDGVPSKHDS